MDQASFPLETIIGLIAAAVHGDDEDARLLVDLLPGSQLRDAVHLLARMLAGAITAPTEAGELPAAWLARVLAGTARREEGE